MGLFTLGPCWPADGGWLMDGMEGRYASCWACAVISWVLPGDSSFIRSAVDRLQRRDSLWNRVRWTFICLNTVTGITTDRRLFQR